MKTMQIISILVLLLSHWQCKKESLSSPIVIIPDSIVSIIWSSAYPNNQVVIGTDNTQYYKNLVLVSGDYPEKAHLIAYNKMTGNKEWEYIHSGSVKGYIINSFVANGIYLAVLGHGLIAIDLDSKSLLWEIDITAAGFRFWKGALSEDRAKFYFSVISENAGLQESGRMLEIDMLTGEYEIIFNTPIDNIDSKFFSPPCFYKDEVSSRKFLICNEFSKTQNPPQTSEQNIVAIDLETKEVVWRTSHFTEHFYSNSLHPPIVYNDIVITGGDWSIYAFNARTGEQLWRYQFNYDTGIWSKTNHLIHDGRLYVNNSQFDVTCLNPETGALIWNNPEGGPNCTDNMVYYEKEDLLVFTSWGYGSVMVLDALTGKTLHRERPKDNSSYNNDVVYDPETDMFFTSTYKSVVGFKVQRPK